METNVLNYCFGKSSLLLLRSSRIELYGKMRHCFLLHFFR
jgi:hypothetical protein